MQPTEHLPTPEFLKGVRIQAQSQFANKKCYKNKAIITSKLSSAVLQLSDVMENDTFLSVAQRDEFRLMNMNALVTTLHFTLLC